MKKIVFTIPCLLAVVLFLSPNLVVAQQNNGADDNKVIVITKTVDDDGNVTIERKTLSKGSNLEQNLEELNLESVDGKDVELRILSDHPDGGDLQIEKSTDDETIFFFRHAENLDREMKQLNDELRSLRIAIDPEDVNWKISCDANAIKMSDKALLGIYPESHPEGGVLVTGVVNGSGAESAGLQKGDIITALNGTSLTSKADLTQAMAALKPGETVSVAYIRDGAPATASATLTAKKAGNYSYNYNYNYNYSYNHHRFDHKNRDVCKPFIGVYTSRTSEGMKVRSVIEGTAAERSYIQPGDVITALDGVPTRSHQELVRERDKHEPGDYFTLTIINNGQAIDIEAQFDDCPEDEVPAPDEETPVEEIPEITPSIDNTLQLESFDAFPNPTYGAVNMRFQGEAVPTIVMIIDVNGKTVFREEVKNFDGIYNRDVNLENVAPGALIVNIQQGRQMFSKSLILLPRA